jgi:hypothetical protein
MEVSGQFHALATLPQVDRAQCTHWKGGRVSSEFVRMLWRIEKSCTAENQTWATYTIAVLSYPD